MTASYLSRFCAYFRLLTFVFWVRSVVSGSKNRVSKSGRTKNLRRSGRIIRVSRVVTCWHIFLWKLHTLPYQTSPSIVGAIGNFSSYNVLKKKHEICKKLKSPPLNGHKKKSIRVIPNLMTASCLSRLCAYFRLLTFVFWVRSVVSGSKNRVSKSDRTKNLKRSGRISRVSHVVPCWNIFLRKLHILPYQTSSSIVGAIENFLSYEFKKKKKNEIHETHVLTLIRGGGPARPPP